MNIRNTLILYKIKVSSLKKIFYFSKSFFINSFCKLKNVFFVQSFWMHDTLSTSQTPTRYNDGWTLENCCMGGGFQAAFPEGYGVSYMIYGEDHSK